MAVPEVHQDGGPVQDGDRSRWRPGSAPSGRPVPDGVPGPRWRPIKMAADHEVDRFKKYSKVYHVGTL